VSDERSFAISSDRRFVSSSDGKMYAVLKMKTKPLYFLVEVNKVRGRYIVALPQGYGIKTGDSRGGGRVTPVVCKLK
jgi:hypothetical protein